MNPTACQIKDYKIKNSIEMRKKILLIVHVTARIGTSCHSIVAPSVLVVYELFTKWHESGTSISYWQVVKSGISKFLPQDGTQYFIWPASPRISTHTVTSSSLIVPPWSLCMYTNLTIFIYISPMGSGRRLVVSTSIPHIFPHAVVYLGLLTSVFQFIIFM